MLSILLKARLSELFASLFGGNKKKRTIPMLVLLGLVLLYATAAMLLVFGMLFAVLLPPLLEAGALHVFFAVGGAAAFLLMLVGNVIFTKNQLYTANDNEFLLAMPIPPRTILFSRLILVLFTSFLFEAIVALPMLLVYLIFAEVRLWVLLAVLLVFLVLPFLAQSIAALLAYLVARISTRIRKKSLLTTLFSLLFLGVYFLFTLGFDEFFDKLSADISPLVRFIDGCMPLAVLGGAMAGKALPLLSLVLLSVAVTAITFLWLSKTFTRTVLENPGAPSVKYRERTVEQKSPLYALTVRELRRLASSSGYMMNAGLGLLFALVPPIFCLVDGSLIDAIVLEMPLLADLLPAACATITAACLSMVVFSAASVSLEGRTLWLVRTLPVPTKTVLHAKVLFHIVPTAPIAALTGILFAIALKASLVEGVLLILFLLAYTLLSATLDLVANLLLPKLEWKNELVAIKQSGAILLAMLGNAVCASLCGGVAILLSFVLPAALALFGGTLFCIGIAAALFAYIHTVGVRQFESL